MRRIELSDAGIHPETLARMLRDRTLTRVTRGLYQLADAEVTASHDLVEVAKLVPKGVICLVSALQFHDLTLQIPGRVWLAIGPKARKPKIDYPRPESYGSDRNRFASAFKPTPSTACRCLSSIQPRQSSTAFDSDSTSVSMSRSKDSTTS